MDGLMNNSSEIQRDDECGIAAEHFNCQFDT